LPELGEALALQRADDFLLDGEVVAFDGARTSFARLQPRIHVSDRDRTRRTGVPVFYHVFDVLRAGGEDLTWLPLLDRKSRLRDLLTFRDRCATSRTGAPPTRTGSATSARAAGRA
jgi:bifunctional non-homologous end joining protein LigD